MCYYAQLEQQVKEVVRRSGLRLDYTEALRLFQLHRDDPSITVSRAFESNFETPANDDEHRSRH